MSDEETPISPTSYHDANRGDFFNRAALQNEDIVEMADAVDKFRAEGLENDLSLPRLVVAGDQSAGKSSVLESLTGLPFPISAGCCTRFCTEIILRRGEKLVKATFPASRTGIPGTTKIKKEYDSFEAKDFKALYEEIFQLLGFPQPGQPSQPAGRGLFASIPTGVSVDVLRIEVTGPNLSPLSIMDTPGLFVSGNSEQNQADVAKIKELVSSLVSDQRAIIVTIVEARRDDSLQEIFNLANKADPKGTRTVGVLTKCDATEKGEETHRAVELAQNRRRLLTNGWFVVKNRSDEDLKNGVSLDVARARERKFFEEMPWRAIAPKRRGIDSLRDFLTELFANHIKENFPSLQKEMRSILEDTREQLSKLGSERETPQQQKRFLNEVIQTYHGIVNACRKGTYVGSDTIACPSKIKLHVGTLTKSFTSTMESSGARRRFKVVDGHVHEDEDELAGRSFDRTIQMAGRNVEAAKQNDIYNWINRRLHESSEPDGLGLIPAPLFSTLFEEQIKPWKELSKEFIKAVGAAMKELIRYALYQSCSDGRAVNKLNKLLWAKVDDAVKASDDKVDQYYFEEKVRMSTCHPAFSERLAQHRANRFAAEIRRTRVLDGETKDLKPILLAPHFRAGYTRTAVYEVHDTLEAYYHEVFWSFTEKVRRLSDLMIITDATALTAISPEWTASLSDEDLAGIVGDTESIKVERNSLRNKVKRLEQALISADRVLPPPTGFSISEHMSGNMQGTPNSQATEHAKPPQSNLFGGTKMPSTSPGIIFSGTSSQDTANSSSFFKSDNLTPRQPSPGPHMGSKQTPSLFGNLTTPTTAPNPFSLGASTKSTANMPSLFSSTNTMPQQTTQEPPVGSNQNAGLFSSSKTPSPAPSIFSPSASSTVKANSPSLFK